VSDVGWCVGRVDGGADGAGGGRWVLPVLSFCWCGELGVRRVE